jgi:hypothetical protein
MQIAYTMESCIDCLAWAANGTVPEERPNLPALILKRLGAEDMTHVVNAERPEDGDGYFSWAGCECCGSGLGGIRGRLAVLTGETLPDGTAVIYGSR